MYNQNNVMQNLGPAMELGAQQKQSAHQERMANPETFGPLPLQSELDEMGYALNTLFEIADRLENRLEPVCLPQPPFGTAEGGVPAPMRSPLSQIVAGKTNDIRVLGGRLNALIERLNL